MAQANKKKCIVLDLDNTLWGGIVGEDGLEGIHLSMDPPGNSFLAFQQALLDYYNKGIILAVNSRNNPEDALRIIRSHPNMVLKEDHFAAMRINWNDKVQNLRELAQELNINLDSMVFFDDDPVNRLLVRTLLPEVEVPELPQSPQEYVLFLNQLQYFDDGDMVTEEDKLRGSFYITEKLRREEKKKFENKEDFLKQLSLNLLVFEDNDSSLTRLSQMTKKTNQFNIFKIPLSELDIKQYIESANYAVFHAKLHDRFGDHGIITFALVEKNKNNWNIKQMLVSCRVFDREVPEALLSVILKKARESGVEKVTISFKETEKNKPAWEFINKYFDDRQYDLSREIYESPFMKIAYEKKQ